MSNRYIINDGDGAPVIDIEVVRAEWDFHKLKNACKHYRVLVNPRELEVTCRDCGVRVNAVEYLDLIVKEWSRFDRNKKAYEEARDKLEQRSRTKCQHCGKMTRISR